MAAAAAPSSSSSPCDPNNTAALPSAGRIAASLLRDSSAPPDVVDGAELLPWGLVMAAPGKTPLYTAAPRTKFFEFVREFYARSANGHTSVSAVVGVCNPTAAGQLRTNLDQLSSLRDNPALSALNRTANPDWMSALADLKGRFRPPRGAPRPANLVFGWHGANAAVAESICRDGLQPLRSTDGGFFTGESYLAMESHYALRYAVPPTAAGDQALLLCVACVGMAHMVTVSDDYDHPRHQGYSKFYATTSEPATKIPQRFDAMYVPTKPYGRVSPKTGAPVPHDVDCQACPNGEATGHELCLPWRQIAPIAIVYVRRGTPTAGPLPPPLSPGEAAKVALRTLYGRPHSKYGLMDTVFLEGHRDRLTFATMYGRVKAALPKPPSATSHGVGGSGATPLPADDGEAAVSAMRRMDSDTIASVFDDPEFGGRRTALIEGRAGVGKTTLSRSLVVGQVAPNRLTLLVELPAVSRSLSQQPLMQPLGNARIREIFSTLVEVALTDRVAFIVAAADRASYEAAKKAVLDLRLPVLWLFDGLDEVLQDDRMAPVLEGFVSSTSTALWAVLGRADDRVLVLSREERDSRRCPFPPGTYTSVLLLPWSADEVRRYVQCVAASLGCDALAATRM